MPLAVRTLGIGVAVGGMLMQAVLECFQTTFFRNEWPPLSLRHLGGRHALCAAAAGTATLMFPSVRAFSVCAARVQWPVGLKGNTHLIVARWVMLPACLPAGRATVRAATRTTT